VYWYSQVYWEEHAKESRGKAQRKERLVINIFFLKSEGVDENRMDSSKKAWPCTVQFFGRI
jgi:hypothetical protein